MSTPDKRPPPVRATPESLGRKHVVKLSRDDGPRGRDVFASYTFMSKLSARALRKALECSQEHVNGEFTIELTEESTR